jgi:hypothetical protein
MGSKLIDDLNKYTNSDSLLVHTKSKGLIRLFCPFTVKVVQSVDSFMAGEQVEVVNVKVSRDLKLVYIINGKGYYHYFFSIQV